MKRNIALTSLSVLMTIVGMNSAYAASSVRSFGGTNTYTSAASAKGAASAEKSSGTSATATGNRVTNVGRAGSVRVTPKTNMSGTAVRPSASASTTAGRGSSIPRLSVGAHLNNSVAGGGSSLRPGVSGDTGGSIGSAELDEFKQEIVDDVDDKLDGFKDTVTSDVLDNVEVRIDELESELMGDEYRAELADIILGSLTLGKLAYQDTITSVDVDMSATTDPLVQVIDTWQNVDATGGQYVLGREDGKTVAYEIAGPISDSVSE